jgi:hypothetical protein
LLSAAAASATRRRLLAIFWLILAIFFGCPTRDFPVFFMTPSFLTCGRQPARLAVARILELDAPFEICEAVAHTGELAMPLKRHAKLLLGNPIFEDQDARCQVFGVPRRLARDTPL